MIDTERILQAMINAPCINHLSPSFRCTLAAEAEPVIRRELLTATLVGVHEGEKLCIRSMCEHCRTGGMPELLDGVWLHFLQGDGVWPHFLQSGDLGFAFCNAGRYYNIVRTRNMIIGHHILGEKWGYKE